MIVFLVNTSFYGETHDIDSNAKQKGTSSLMNEINNDLRLTIYYLSLNTLTLYPLQEKDLKNVYYEYKIEVTNSVLRDHAEELAQIDNLKLPKSSKDKANLRVFCEFISKTGIVYTFGLGVGQKGDILIDGEFYNYNKIFYDFVSDFIPYSEIKYFQN